MLDRRSQLVLVLGLALAVPAVVMATPILLDTSVGVGADTYVRLGQASTNFGTAAGVVVKDAGTGSTTRQGYLRLDVASMPGVLTDATLTLDVSDNNSGGGDPTPKQFTVEVFGLIDGHAGESWSETGITWSNAPGNNTSNNLVTGDAIQLGTFIVPALATSTVTFSDPKLKSFLNADTDGQATLILRRRGGSSGANLTFASKENTTFSAPALSGEAVAAELVSITTNEGNGADAFVRKGTATTNYGSDATVLTKNAGTGSTTRKGYLRFDITSVNQDIVEAYLGLDVNSNNAGGGSSAPREQIVNLFGLVDGDPGENWGESTITWNNAPANDKADNDLLSNATLLGQFTIPEATPPDHVIFSTQELLDFVNLDTDGQLTFIMTRVTSNGSYNLGFASGEHGSLMAPTLTLAVLPEPSTFALLALGLAACIRRRRQTRA